MVDVDDARAVAYDAGQLSSWRMCNRIGRPPQNRPSAAHCAPLAPVSSGANVHCCMTPAPAPGELAGGVVVVAWQLLESASPTHAPLGTNGAGEQVRPTDSSISAAARLEDGLSACCFGQRYPLARMAIPDSPTIAPA